MAGGLCNAILPGLGDGSFGPPSFCDHPFTVYQIVGSGHMDGDGKLDLIAFAISLLPEPHDASSRLAPLSGGSSMVVLGAPAGYFDRTGDIRGSDVGTPPLTCAVGDVNRDGHADLVMVGAFGGSAAVLLDRGNGSFPLPHGIDFGPPEAGAFTSFIMGRDVDSDGRSDLIVGLHRNAGIMGVGVYRTAGVSTEVSLPYYPVSATFGDLNGDGIPDMALRYDWLFHPGDAVLGHANGTFGANIDLDPGPDATSLEIGDFDQDGYGDLAVTNGSPATLSALRGNGDGTFGAPVLVSSSGPYGGVHIGDLDRDVLLDLVLPSGSDVAVLRGRGDGTFDPRTGFPAGGVVNDIVLGDFNGDGNLDVAAALASGTSVLLGFGDGSLASPLVEAGRAAGTITASDLDGDGRLDLAFNSTGVTFVLGRGDGTFGVRTNLGADVGAHGLAILGPDTRNHLTLATGTGKLVILMPGTIDLPTEAQLLLFEADASIAGIEVRWQIRSSEQGPSPVLERADHEAGPWSPVEREQRVANEITVVVDDSAAPGRLYYYRIVVASESGTPVVFGPISATAGGSARMLSLAVGPNPARGEARFDFDLPSESHAKLVVLDLQGRVLSTLNEGKLAAGHHRLIWSGRGTTPGNAGVFFVCSQTPHQVLTRRFVLLH